MQAQKAFAGFIHLLTICGDVGRQGVLYSGTSCPSLFEAGMLYSVTLWL